MITGCSVVLLGSLLIVVPCYFTSYHSDRDAALCDMLNVQAPTTFSPQAKCMDAQLFWREPGDLLFYDNEIVVFYAYTHTYTALT